MPSETTEARMHALLSLGQELAAEQSELAQSDSRFRAYLDGAPFLAWIKDPEGRYVFVNRQAAVLFGWTVPDVLGKTDPDLRPARIAQVSAAHDRRALRKGARVEGIERLSLAAGETREFRVTRFSFLCRENRRYLGVMATELSERLPPETARSLAGRWLETLPHAAVFADESGRIRFANRSAEILFQRAEGALCGQPILSLVPTRYHAALSPLVLMAANPLAAPACDAPLSLLGQNLRHEEFPIEMSLTWSDLAGEPLLLVLVRDSARQAIPLMQGA